MTAPIFLQELEKLQQDYSTSLKVFQVLKIQIKEPPRQSVLDIQTTRLLAETLSGTEKGKREVFHGKVAETWDTSLNPKTPCSAPMLSTVFSEKCSLLTWCDLL